MTAIVKSAARASALVAWLLAGVAVAAPETASHPVQVYFDGEPHAARMWVRYTRELYDLDYDVYRQRATGEADRAFVALIDALRTTDPERARPLLDTRAARGTTAQVVARLRSSFGQFRHVHVVMRAHIGERRVFYFRTREGRAQGIFTAGFSFSRRDGRWQGELVTGNLPVAALIADGLDGLARAPSAFAPVARTDARFAVPLDPDATVHLEFDAERLDIDPFGDGPPPATPETALWVQGMIYVRAAAWADYAALHTPASRRKIAEWNGRSDDRARRQAAAVLSSGVRLKARIPLGDIGALLIYSQGDTADATQHVLRYAWVARTPEGLKLTNYFKRYALGAAFARVPGWPERAGELRETLDRFERGAR